MDYRTRHYQKAININYEFKCKLSVEKQRVYRACSLSTHFSLKTKSRKYISQIFIEICNYEQRKIKISNY